MPKGLATAAATGVAGQHMSRRRDRGSSDVYVHEYDVAAVCLCVEELGTATYLQVENMISSCTLYTVAA